MIRSTSFITLSNVTLLAYVVLANSGIRYQRQASRDCQTAYNEPGICINIKQCSKMVELLKNSNNNWTVVDYLRRSTCGFEGNDPKVCCPDSEKIFPDPDKPRAGLISSLPTPPNCGKSANLDLPRIVGGRPAELGQWPWMVALGYRSRRDPQKVNWLCGGALITERYIVTAAHCLFHPSLQLFRVRLGDLDLNDNIDDGATPQERSISKQIPHEAYSKTKFTDDIALLQMDKPVDFTKLIQPICLPKLPEMRSNNFYKLTPFVTGWGSVQFKGPSASHLQEIQLPVIENERCMQAFKPKGADITSKQLCAGYLTGSKDACQGDSGGPLMLPRGEHFYLIGVVSFGYKCAEKGFPGVYTRVTEYIDWISKNIK